MNVTSKREVKFSIGLEYYSGILCVTNNVGRRNRMYKAGFFLYRRNITVIRPIYFICLRTD